METKKTVITLGQKIRHDIFGIGKIVGAEKDGSLMVTIRFENGQKKDFLYPHSAIKLLDEEPEKPVSAQPANTSNNASIEKKLRTVYAKTHKDFLNTVFGCNYKGFMQTTWPYHGNKDFVVWMVRFNCFFSPDWRNELFEKDGVLMVRESYTGSEEVWKKQPLIAKNIVGKERIVVGVEGEGYQRKYRIYGVFGLCPGSTGKLRLWTKISDEIAYRKAPEIFE